VKAWCLMFDGGINVVCDVPREARPIVKKWMLKGLHGML